MCLTASMMVPLSHNTTLHFTKMPRSSRPQGVTCGRPATSPVPPAPAPPSKHPPPPPPSSSPTHQPPLNRLTFRKANQNNITTPPTTPTTHPHPSTRSPAAAADGKDVVGAALVVDEGDNGVEDVALPPEPPWALDPEGLGRSSEPPVCCGVVLDVADVRSVWGSVLAELTLGELPPPVPPEAWHLPSVVQVVPALQ